MNVCERKPVPQFEGFYEVDRTGVVYSIPRIVPRGDHEQVVPGGPLKPIVHKVHGYCLVGLCRPGFRRQRRLHIIVAIAFVSNPKGKPTVNHIDGDKPNNADRNLEWATHEEQMLHAMRLRLMPYGDRNGSIKITSDLLSGFRDRILAGELIQDLATSAGVNRNTITKALTREYGNDWDCSISGKRARAANVRWGNV